MDFREHGYVPIGHNFEWMPETIAVAGIIRRGGESMDDATCRVEAKSRRLWSWLERTTPDGVVEGADCDMILDEVDMIARCEGFARALESVGWLERCARGVEFVCVSSYLREKTRRQERSREIAARRYGRRAEKRRRRIRAIGRCVYCGSTEEIVCDHFVPIAKGGQDVDDNVVPACAPCNAAKSDREFDTVGEAAAWLREKRGLPALEVAP